MGCVEFFPKAKVMFWHDLKDSDALTLPETLAWLVHKGTPSSTEKNKKGTRYSFFCRCQPYPCVDDRKQ